MPRSNGSIRHLVKGKPLMLTGQSLGVRLKVTTLSAQHPERQKQLKALVLDSAPASYRSVGQYVLSTSWLTWPFQVPLSWPDGDSAIQLVAQLKVCRY